jgi:hypothetical protein
LADFLIHDIGALHDLIDFERFLAEGGQDLLSIIQHDYLSELTNRGVDFRMSRLDHEKFDIAVLKSSRRKSVTRHFFDDWPICEKVLLRLYLRLELCLQNAALPRVPIRYLKSHRLWSLVDLLFSGFNKLPHVLLLP